LCTPLLTLKNSAQYRRPVAPNAFLANKPRVISGEAYQRARQDAKSWMNITLA